VRIVAGSAKGTRLAPVPGGEPFRNRRVAQILPAEGGLLVSVREEGLFLLRAGSSTFERFTMADGLRPYGYMADGSDPPGVWRHLEVISVAGGPAGTVFVGYEGLPGCAYAFETYNFDPAYRYLWKSGDADRVTLNGAGITVAHYDISSGPGVVAAERQRLDGPRVRRPRATTTTTTKSSSPGSSAAVAAG